MLSKPDAKVLFDQDSKAIGVESEGQVAKAKFVVGDPSYFPDKVVRTSNVVRAICILSHPIPNTDNSHSVQIILPQKQVRVWPYALQGHSALEGACPGGTIMCQRRRRSGGFKRL